MPRYIRVVLDARAEEIFFPPVSRQPPFFQKRFGEIEYYPLSDAHASVHRERSSPISHDASFADRLKTAAAAKQAQLEKFQPRTAAQAPEFVNRRDRRVAELEAVRRDRAEKRDAARLARVNAEAAAAKDLAAQQMAALEAKRLDRKLRKSARRQDRSDSLAAFSRRVAD